MAFNRTVIDDADMASAAKRGVAKPAIATGTARTDSSLAPKHFLCGVFVVSAILAMPLVHVATSVSFLLMQSLAVRPFQSELTVTDSMDASDGPTLCPDPCP